MKIKKKFSKRIHDHIYKVKKPLIKESFKFLLKEILKKQKNFETLIDIGCSNGAFLSYLNQELKNKHTCGVDVRGDLIKLAKKNSPSSIFYKYDITKKNKVVKKKFDVVILDGVHSIFDDTNLWLKNTLKLCNKNGKVYIFGSFNPEPYDVIVRVKKFKSNIYETGFNRLSLSTLKHEMKKNKFRFEAKKFKFKLKLKKNLSDPRRTYTIKINKNDRLTVNGLEQISSKFLIIGTKKK